MDVLPRPTVLAVLLFVGLCGLGPGDRFVAANAIRVVGLETPAPQLALVDEHGQPAKLDDIENRVLTLKTVTQGHWAARLTFSLAGTARTYTASADPGGTAVPGLAEISSDTESRALASRYGGRTVWTRTAAEAICANGSAGPLVDLRSDLPVWIEHIVRLTNFPTQFADFGKIGGWQNAPFMTSNPILVTLRRPSNIVTEAGKNCAEFTARFAAAADFERYFRLRSRRASHPDWTPEMFAEITAGRVLVGMTHDMIAEMLGYPSIRGSIEQLDRLEKWKYPAPAPWGFTVYFHGDRVWAYDPPRDLP